MNVTGIALYTAAIQTQYFGTSITAEKLKSLMERYGIKESGNAAYDLQALRDAMYSAATTKAKSTQAAANSREAAMQSMQSQPTTDAADVPWASLMNQMGLPLTGSLEGDYNAFSQKLLAMSISAHTPQDKAQIAQFQAQASIVFVQQNQQTSQVNSASQKQVTGADILAQMNKMYFLG